MRKTERNLHARVARRLVFEFGMRRQEVGELFGVHPDTISDWLRHWCVIFPVRGAPYLSFIRACR